MVDDFAGGEVVSLALPRGKICKDQQKAKAARAHRGEKEIVDRINGINKIGTGSRRTPCSGGAKALSKEIVILSKPSLSGAVDGPLTILPSIRSVILSLSKDQTFRPDHAGSMNVHPSVILRQAQDGISKRRAAINSPIPLKIQPARLNILKTLSF
jgi:hypothetical protein